jgi:hypothetical protein
MSYPISLYQYRYGKPDSLLQWLLIPAVAAASVSASASPTSRAAAAAASVSASARPNPTSFDAATAVSTSVQPQSSPPSSVVMFTFGHRLAEKGGGLRY